MVGMAAEPSATLAELTYTNRALDGEQTEDSREKI